MHTPKEKITFGRSGILPCRLLGFALIFLWTASPCTGGAEVVDHIVAAVNNEVITARDLRQALLFNEAMGSRAAWGEEAESTLNGLIHRRLLVNETRRLAFAEVSDREIAAEIENVRKRFGSDEEYESFLRKMEITPDQLSRMLGERLLVERFVEKKVGLFVRVSRQEAQKYYDAHIQEFRGKSFPEVSKAITELLAGQKIDQQLTQYLAELRSKAFIRINQL